MRRMMRITSNCLLVRAFVCDTVSCLILIIFAMKFDLSFITLTFLGGFILHENMQRMKESYKASF